MNGFCIPPVPSEQLSNPEPETPKHRPQRPCAMPLRWSLADPVASVAISMALQKELFAASQLRAPPAHLTGRFILQNQAGGFGPGELLVRAPRRGILCQDGAQPVKHVRAEVERGGLVRPLARDLAGQTVPADGSRLRVEARAAEGRWIQQVLVGALVLA